jgi:signal transduction histidine kinase
VKWRWIIPVVPAGLSLAAAVLFATGRLENPIVRLRVDVGTLVLVFGLTFAALLASVLALFEGLERVRRESLARAQAQATQERRRFLQRLDHELKNPLTAIRAGLANMAEGTTPEARRAAFKSVEHQTLRLSRLAADLRKLAELETRPLEHTPVKLAELIREVVETAQERRDADTRHLRVTLPQAPWPLPTIYGDWDLLFLAIHNLVDNALKFSLPGDTVEIRAFEDGASVVLEVADTGPGIPGAEADHVWEELYRGEGARGIRGSGLGLPLVRAVAERHGGEVLLRSRAGQGTVITLRLPVPKS